jgi:hypothetical protein
MASYIRHLILIIVVLLAPPRAWAAGATTETTAPAPTRHDLSATGRPTDPGFFPLGVWLQNPDHIAEFKAIGINVFVGFYGNLDQASLAKFADSGMPVIAEQNPTALTSPQRTAIIGWLAPDEPDNSQPNGFGGYGPCFTPGQLIALYNNLKTKDPSRPILLGFGRGVSDIHWNGRGTCTGQTESYYPYAVGGGDIISFDVYPVANYGGRLAQVPNGIDNLKAWIAKSGSDKVIWNAIEAVPVNSGDVPTAAQERAEVWMSIIHGSHGIVYFVHQFGGRGDRLVREDGIFNFPNLVHAVAAVNAEITGLAPVLNSPTIVDGVSVSSHAATPVASIVKQQGGATYVFAVAERNNADTATFTLPGMRNGTVQVLGERRERALSNGVFQDEFDGYGVHLYRIIGK